MHSATRAASLRDGDGGKQGAWVWFMPSMGAALILLVALSSWMWGRPSTSPVVDVDSTLRRKRRGPVACQGAHCLAQPPERVSAHGILNTTLRLVVRRLRTGPLRYEARTYDGLPFGPTLRVRPGDRLVIHLQNGLGPDPPDGATAAPNTLHLPNTTNLHVHGMHVSPAGTADNIFRAISPGTGATYEYHIPSDHQPGLFYYHPHHHGSSLVQTMAGMAGCIVVEDPGAAPEGLKRMRELVLGLQHVRMQGSTLSNYIVAANKEGSTMPLRVHQTTDTPDALNHILVNGQYHPTIRIRPLEVMRWRVVNAGYTACLRLHLPGCRIHVLAADGVFYAKPRSVSRGGTVLLAPGSRRELAVMCPARGVYALTSSPAATETERAFLGPTEVFLGPVLKVEVSGRPFPMSLPKSLPRPSDRLFQDLRTAKGVRPFSFLWSKTGGKWGINGRPYDPGRVDREVPLGAVEQWTVGSGVPQLPTTHPFHLHTNHFQIVAVSEGEGVDYEVGDWRDTILSPVRGTVTVRWRANDFTGLSVAHCHIFSHSDTGMDMDFVITDT